MSGAGAAERDEVDGTGVHVAIVAGRWHETIAGGSSRAPCVRPSGSGRAPR